MSRPRHRRLRALFLALAVVALGLPSGELRASPLVAARPAASAGLLTWAGELWRIAGAVWLGLPAAAPGRHRSRRAGSGLDAVPTCDAGGTLDPNGHCVYKTVHSPVFRVTCDAGGSLDPSGRCGH